MTEDSFQKAVMLNSLINKIKILLQQIDETMQEKKGKTDCGFVFSEFSDGWGFQFVLRGEELALFEPTIKFIKFTLEEKLAAAEKEFQNL